MSFQLAYYENGRLKTDPFRIWHNYIRGWFAFDLFVVLPEWVAYIFRGMIPIYHNSSLIKLFRIVRILRLARVMKLRKFKHEILCRIHSDRFLFTIWISCWLGAVLGMVHILACLWYSIGNGPRGWVEVFKVAREPLPDRYMIALQWCFSSIHGRSQVYPVTRSERIFSLLFSVLCGFLLVLVISGTTSMLQGRFRKAEFNSLAVRSFLARHKVARHTAVRLQRVVEDESNLLDQREQQGEMMKLLPRELLKEIMVQVRGAVLSSSNSVFIYSQWRFPQFFRRMCHEVAKDEHWPEGDVVFCPGYVCNAARCVAKGRFIYSVTFGNEPPTSHDREATQSQWVCEVVLWTPWKNVGTLTAVEDSMMFLIPMDTFTEVASDYVEVRYSFALYAQKYLLYINDRELTHDLIMNIPAGIWESDGFDKNVGQDPEPIPLPWAEDLPPHLAEQVCKAAVLVAQRIATHGLDENRPHHGFTIIVGDEVALESCGKAGFNPFFGHRMCLLDKRGLVDEEVFDTLRRNAFHADGAIVINAETSRVVASGWFIADISKGGSTGGARSRSARAIAQQAGGCYVIKCSEDSGGGVTLHLNTKRMTFDGTLQLDPAEACHGEDGCLCSF